MACSLARVWGRGWKPGRARGGEPSRVWEKVKKKSWRVQGPAKARVAGSRKRRRDWGREGLGRPL